MMEFAKDLVSNVSSVTADFAKMLGETTAELAKRVGGNTADLAKRVGGSSADLAKRVGGGTVDLAKRVGPKRGLIGLALVGVAVGGTIVLVRYLKTRAEAMETEGEEAVANGAKKNRRKFTRAERKAQHLHAQVTH